MRVVREILLLYIYIYFFLAFKTFFITYTELQLLYILILARTCLVVFVAEHPLLYIARLFCYIPL